MQRAQSRKPKSISENEMSANTFARPTVMSDGWPEHGFLRADQVIGSGRLPISRSQFWVLVRERNIMPLKISPRVTVFAVDELRTKLLGGGPKQATATVSEPKEPGTRKSEGAA